MDKIVLGLVPAPGLPSEISNKLQEKLPEMLQKELPEDTEWEIEYETDRLTGAADSIKTIMDQAKSIKKRKQWDYTISLTDLPVFHGKFIVLSDVDTEEKMALVSLPAFGIAPTVNRTRKTMIHIIKELYYRGYSNQDNIQFSEKGIGIQEATANYRFFNKISKAFKISTLKRIKFKEKYNGANIRFVIKSKLSGKLNIISGLTLVNRPWSIMPSFRKVIGLAFATGTYMLIFNTLWKLSGLYGFFRFLTIMFLAIFIMVTWLIFAHSLWEKKTASYSTEKLRLLYNATTVTTLTFAVITFYCFVFFMFLMAVVVFVPADIFKDSLGHSAEIADYIKLAWLVSSAATLAGSIGAGLEEEDAVKKSAYGYRQYTRSKELKEREKEDREQESRNQEKETEKDKEEEMKEKESEEKSDESSEDRNYN